MARFFMAGGNIRGGVAIIKGDDAGHVKALRLRLGDRLVICDGEGSDYQCKLTRLGKDSAEAIVEETVPSAGEPALRYSALCAFCKGDRADYIIQKCVECGADEIVFFPSERCVSQPGGGSLAGKLRRWRRISEEAAKQSGRGVIPEVRALDGFDKALDAALKSELALFMYETGERVTIKEALRGAGALRSVAVITGPEGGFERYEADLARAAGIPAVSMGPRILRCETAPVVALTAVMYETGNL